jgi:DNA helicase-2/ATP-dependent DNA helicase PcrA
MANYLDDLNSKQREAVEQIDGPILILAGAGAGKTKTITHRIVHIIHKGTAPENILAVTFTNKAAKEMRNRVSSLIKEETSWDGEIPFVSTFHALGVHILRQQYEYHSRNKYFTILDQKDATATIKQAIKELGLDPKVHDAKKIKNFISSQKGKCKSCEMFMSAGENSPLAEITSQIWNRYEDLLEKQNSYDFDDLLFETVKLLEGKGDVKKFYQETWKYIHVDEYQDTNEAQYRIVNALAQAHRNLCVVGDIDQTIYSWRGANIKNILNFEKDYEDAMVVILEENYRSTQKILHAANEVIKKNENRKEKNLFTKNKEGENIEIFEALNERREASSVAEKIQNLLNDGANPNEVAILYRANFQSRVLEEQMIGYNLPYQVLGIRFFDRKEVKDLISYLKLSLNPESVHDLARAINTPKRGIGKVTLGKVVTKNLESLSPAVKLKVNNFYTVIREIKEFSAKNTVSQIVAFALQKSGLELMYKESGDAEDIERLENLRELVTHSLKYDVFGGDVGLQKMLEDVALASDQDSLEQNTQGDTPRVKLMTVHASKGLEFDYVFVVGMEQDVFPHSFNESSKSKDESEEERRLFYVALTRAREKVFLSHAMVRTIYGEQKLQNASEFLGDIPNDILDVFQDEHSHSQTGKKIPFGESDDSFEFLVID